MNLREKSRAHFTASENPTFEAINTGSLQRIADAIEKMAANWDALVRDREYSKCRAQEEREARACANLSRIALRGVVTRLRNRMRKGKR